MNKHFIQAKLIIEKQQDIYNSVTDPGGGGAWGDAPPPPGL